MLRDLESVRVKPDDEAQFSNFLDPVRNLRTRMLIADSFWKLQEILYDAERLISSDPHNIELLQIRDTIHHALHKERNRVAVGSQAPSADRAHSGPLPMSGPPKMMASARSMKLSFVLFWGMIFVLIGMLLGGLYFLVRWLF
jgi:hypothetical protein